MKTPLGLRLRLCDGMETSMLGHRATADATTPDRRACNVIAYEHFVGSHAS